MIPRPMMEVLLTPTIFYGDNVSPCCRKILNPVHNRAMVFNSVKYIFNKIKNKTTEFDRLSKIIGRQAYPVKENIRIRTVHQA